MAKKIYEINNLTKSAFIEQLQEMFDKDTPTSTWKRRHSWRRIPHY